MKKSCWQTHNLSDFNPAPFAEVVEYLAAITRSKKPGRIPPWLARLLLGREVVGILTNSCQNRANTLDGWAPAYPSYREGYGQIVSLLGEP